MTITQTPNPVLVAQEFNITCVTSYSYPPANITWYMSSLVITSQSTSRTQNKAGFVRTVSSLISEAGKNDNERHVYCKANNTLSTSVTSRVHTLIVMCKYIKLHPWFKEVGPRTAKLALLLIKFMKFGIVQFLFHDYLEESPNCVYIPNIHHLKLICMKSRHIHLSNFLLS